MSISRKLLILIGVVVLMALPVGTALAQQAVTTSEETVVFMGTAVIWDDQALSDAITYAMENVPAPSGGTELVGWLVSDDGSVKLNTGVMTIAADGSIGHVFDSTNARYTGENLIHNYDKVVITEEAIGADPDAPAGPPVYSHVIPTAAMAHIRHLLTNWPPGTDKGILTNLQEQLKAAITHANLSARSTTLDAITLHAHHVINIVEGKDGPNFDASFGNPGDGLGVLLHAGDRKHGPFAAGAAPDDEVVTGHAAEVDRIGAAVAAHAETARDRALQVIEAAGRDKETLARIFLGPGADSALSHLEVALNGFMVGDDLKEEGAVHAYKEAQLMATYTLEPGGPGAAAAAPTVGDATVPLLAQLAFIAAIVLLGGGGLLMVRVRRVRVRA